MAYFNRKDIVRIFSEKPDMMSAFPETVLNSKQRDEMACIPDIALCDITMMADPQALDQFFLKKRPDAILPSVAYCGVERVRWSNFDSTVAALKKTFERTWHVHVLQPVALGAPLFRSALCMYAGMQEEQQTRSALQCAACTFYRAAVYIPLCKQFAISKLYLGGCAPCCSQAAALEHAAGLAKYCKILLSGYGIDLFMVMPSANAVQPEDDDCYEPVVSEFECFADISCGSGHALPAKPGALLKRYFENFAIPFAANVMSRLLAGHDVDFVATARSFLPIVRDK
jgi:hypothetical protein